MTSVTAFSTVGLPGPWQVERWEEHNAGALIGLRCRPLGPALDAVELNLQLERIHLARVRGTAHVVERDLKLVRRQPADAVALYLQFSGESSFAHAAGETVLRAGQMLIWDADRPFRRTFGRGLEELVVKVPRPVFTELTGRSGIDRPVVVGPDGGARGAMVRALGRDVAAAVRGDRGVDEDRLLDLLGALMGGANPAFAAATAWIEEHLAEATVAAPRVAAAAGVSTRQLSRVFAERGTSVPRFVRERRLTRARAELRESRSTVAEIARRCGFTSAAHFSTAFTARFGAPPSELRGR
jgi:AraC-like DNA-binding protein